MNLSGLDGKNDVCNITQKIETRRMERPISFYHGGIIKRSKLYLI